MNKVKYAPDISLMCKVLRNEADTEEIDIKRATSSFFRTLYNQSESLFLKDGLLLRCKWPMKFEKHIIAIVLEPSDSMRRMVQIHCKCHRQFMYVYAMFNMTFYTPGAMSIAIKVCSQCTICSQMQYRKRLKCERANCITTRCAWYLDHKGPLMVKGNTAGYILVAVESTLRLVNFSYVNGTTAKETAEAIFTNILANYGNCTEIITDRGTSFVNDLNASLMSLGSIHHRVSSSYHPQSESCEGYGVRPLSGMLRATLFDKPMHKLPKYIKYMQLICNSLQTHPFNHNSPFSATFGNEQGFYHPCLTEKNVEVTYPEFWERKISFMREITEHFRKKYDLYLCQARSDRQTVHTLKIRVNDLVWYRVFQYPQSAKYLKSILPKFRLAVVIRILGPTSVILQDKVSTRQLSRHLSDIYRVKLTGSFSNLYLTSFDSTQDEMREIETDIIDPLMQDKIVRAQKLRFDPQADTQENEMTDKRATTQRAGEGDHESDSGVKKSGRVLRDRKPIKYTK